MEQLKENIDAFDTEVVVLSEETLLVWPSICP
jgi:hypothetical protein